MLVGDLSEEASGSRFCCIDGWSDGCLVWWLVDLSRALYRLACRDPRWFVRRDASSTVISLRLARLVDDLRIDCLHHSHIKGTSSQYSATLQAGSCTRARLLRGGLVCRSGPSLATGASVAAVLCASVQIRHELSPAQPAGSLGQGKTIL